MGKLYYTDTGRDVIASCNLDGSNEQIIVSSLLDEPRAIVLDTENRSVNGRYYISSFHFLYQ